MCACAVRDNRGFWHTAILYTRLRLRRIDVLVMASPSFATRHEGGPSQVQHCSPPSGSGGGKPATSDVAASKIAVLSFPLFPLKVKVKILVCQ